MTALLSLLALSTGYHSPARLASLCAHDDDDYDDDGDGDDDKMFMMMMMMMTMVIIW